MIDIDTIIQNIEDKIDLLEKLKFDDDPKNFLYTPITAVTITSTTDFKQLECQKFIRCTRSNKLIPLGKFSDTVEALKDENSENLSNGNEKDAKIGQKAINEASVQQKRNYRRNSIAYFDQKVPLEEKKSLAGKKRRNSTKFDIQKPSEVKNPIENGQKKPKVTPAASKPFTTQTNSPLVTPRPSLSTQPSKNPPLTKLDQQYTLKKPTHQAQNTTAPPAGSPKFSRSYTEFLSNLNKDMKKFKEQQMRNEPCDNFLGKDAKMFVEDPIAKHLGDVRDTKVGVTDRKVDFVKANGNKDEAVKNMDPKPATSAKIDPKLATTAKVDTISTNKSESIIKIPDSPPKTPIYGLKYLVKAPKTHPEPSKNIFGKIIKNPTENAPKLLNKIVMRRMTIDSSWDHRSLLRMKSDVSTGESSPKVQKVQLPGSSPAKVNPLNIEGSPEKLQKIPAVNQDLIHQKIIRLSPQKPQNSNDDLKPDKLTKPQQNILKSLKQKIPRRNSIGYGVRIETANDIKRLKLSQDVRKSLGGLEAVKRVQELANGSSELKKRRRKPRKNIQNAETIGKIDKKVCEAPAVMHKEEFTKLIKKSNISDNLIKNAVLNTPITSIDFEDELENISACHIDKLAPTRATIEGQPNNSKTDMIIEDVCLQSTKSDKKSANSKTEKVNKGNRKVKSNKSLHTADIEKSDTKAENIITSESIQVKKRGRPSKKLKIDDKEDGEIKVKDVDMKLCDTDQKNNNLEDIEQERNKVNSIADRKDTEDITKSKEAPINNKVQSEEDNKDSIDVVTSKTMDIFRDIENYRNLIRQRSSDSQSSNKTVESVTKSVTNSQERNKRKQKVEIAPKSLVKVEDKLQKRDEIEEKGEKNLKVQKESELVQQDVKLDPQNTEPNIKNSVTKPKIVDLSSQISSQPPQSSQNVTQLSQNSQLSSQLSQNSQNSSQSSQPSQNSITGTPIMSQSPQLSDSQTTSTPDQSLGKRRRQINPKYKESEYLLKNTSREFTNAIRSKMMVNKSQKTSGKKQSVKPDEQTLSKSEKTLETSKSVEAASTSASPARPASTEIKCEICGKTFIKPQGLTRHMPLHSTDRRYKCSKCDYRFKQSSDLMRHMLLHEGSPTIPCTQCDKKFRTAKNLQAHMETHEDTLPYKCDQCEIRFRSSKNLRYHLMSHHSGVKFQCGYCGNKFSDEKSLRTHVMQHETEDEDLDDEELEDYLDFMDEEEEELEDSDDEPMVIAENMILKIAFLIFLIIIYKCQQAPSPDAVMSGSDAKVYTNPPSANVAGNYSVCTQPKFSGSCRSMMPRFYYDTEQKKCLGFTYGGCSSNGNNFETLAKCNETCGAFAKI